MIVAHSRALVCGLLLAAGCVLGTSARAADEVAAPEADTLANVIAQLNSDRFEVRNRAALQLGEWAKQSSTQQPLAAALERVLLVPETSYEMRLLCRAAAG